MIWGTDVLKNRSVTGVATKKKKDAVPKPPLSPHKLSVVRGRAPAGQRRCRALSSSADTSLAMPGRRLGTESQEQMRTLSQKSSL